MSRNLSRIRTSNIILPEKNSFVLPVKIVQFGNSASLRSLVGYWINECNRRHLFNGRITVVVPLLAIADKMLNEQNGLYTILTREWTDGREKTENLICNAIKQVFAFDQHLPEILTEIIKPEIKVIIYDADALQNTPPALGATDSGNTLITNLLMALNYRYMYSLADKGTFVLISMRLSAPETRDKLIYQLIDLAQSKHMDNGFTNWLAEKLLFCESFVERKLLATPHPDVHDAFTTLSGYYDPLLLIKDQSYQWTITGNIRAKAILAELTALENVAFITEQATNHQQIKALCIIAETKSHLQTLTVHRGKRTVNKIIQEVTDRVLKALFGQIAHEECDVARLPDLDRAAALLAGFLLEHYRTYNQLCCKTVSSMTAFIIFVHNVYMISLSGESTLSNQLTINFSIFHSLWQQGSHRTAIHLLLSADDIWHGDLNALPHFADKLLEQLL